MMSSHMVIDRQQSASAPLVSDDEAPVKHLHLKENSSIPSFLRHTGSFAITRVESSRGLADPITKVSNVPALLVSVSIKSVAACDYHVWFRAQTGSSPHTPPFRAARA